MNRREIAGKVRTLVQEFEATKSVDCYGEGGGITRHLLAISSYLQLSVVEDPMLTDGQLGEFNRDLMRISLKPNLSKELWAFTLGHEVGHAVLGSRAAMVDDDKTIDEESGISLPDNGILPSYDPGSREELLANLFAAELLAPSWKVNQLIAEDPNWSVEQLAARFGISRKAMVSQISSSVLTPDYELEEKSPNAQVVELDPKQQEAITAKTPTLVVAGPGAGKTKVLVEKFVSLVQQGFEPSRILALTFSNKAAGEMVERIANRLGEGTESLSVSTFHSFGLETLKLYGPHLGYEKPPVLLAPAEVFELLRENLPQIPLGLFEDLRKPTRSLKELMDAVSRAKDELRSAKEYLEIAEEALKEADALTPSDPKRTKKARQMVDAANFFAAYEKIMRDRGAADYGDLIRYAVALLSDPEVGDSIAKQYDWILVDETQDINFATAEMLQLLDRGRDVIWAVGDPRQSIYRFRGASAVSLVNYQKRFVNTTVVELEANYRSTQCIVDFGQAFPIPKRTAGDDLRVPKLKSGREVTSNEAVIHVEAPDEYSELTWLASEIADLEKSTPLESIAVLCRTRAQAQSVSSALRRFGIANTWAGSLDNRFAFKEVMGALYAAADDPIALPRLWTGGESDLRILMSARKNLRTSSLLHLLFEARDSKVEGLSENGIQLAKSLSSMVGALQSFKHADQVVERFVFQYSSWARSTVSAPSIQNYVDRKTLGELLALAKAYVKRNEGGDSSPKGFIRHMRVAQEVGDLKQTRFDVLPGMVQVLTIHASKGLEWPIVFLPYIAKQKMPSNRTRDRLPIPPGLIHGEDASDPAIEKACLFYVALTRARDRLYVSCATKYGRFNCGMSEYVTDLIGKLESKSIVRIVTAQAVAEAAKAPSETIAFDLPETIPFAYLTAIDDCPKQFEFRHILGLHDEDRGYLDFHQSVYGALEYLLNEKAEGKSVSESEVVGKLHEIWVSGASVDHWYGSKFVATAESTVRSLYQKVESGELTSGRVNMAFQVGTQNVSLPVDEVERTSSGIVFKRHVFGPPSDGHLDKDQQVALHLCSRLHAGENSPVTMVKYPLLNIEVPAPFLAGKLKNRREKFEALVAIAQHGPYEVSPGDCCKSCLANMVCPSVVDGEDD